MCDGPQKYCMSNIIRIFVLILFAQITDENLFLVINSKLCRKEKNFNGGLKDITFKL